MLRRLRTRACEGVSRQDDETPNTGYGDEQKAIGKRKQPNRDRPMGRCRARGRHVGSNGVGSGVGGDTRWTGRGDRAADVVKGERWTAARDMDNRQDDQTVFGGG